MYIIKKYTVFIQKAYNSFTFLRLITNKNTFNIFKPVSFIIYNFILFAILNKTT